MTAGRPSTYTPELADEILTRIALGELVREILKSPGMPSPETLRRWRVAHPEFRAAYARARIEQAEALAERAVNDAYTAANPVVGRLKFDAGRWLASRLDPKNYGDKLTSEHTGANGGPISVETVTTYRLPDNDR